MSKRVGQSKLWSGRKPLRCGGAGRVVFQRIMISICPVLMYALGKNGHTRCVYNGRHYVLIHTEEGGVSGQRLFSAIPRVHARISKRASSPETRAGMEFGVQSREENAIFRKREKVKH